MCHRLCEGLALTESNHWKLFVLLHGTFDNTGMHVSCFLYILNVFRPIVVNLLLSTKKTITLMKKLFGFLEEIDVYQ